ncbi:MAG: sensor histidine kinase [Lachnospiraceae bacterium]|nr:sensor histidine kinase [Lachnospiraceae bacterium]
MKTRSIITRLSMRKKLIFMNVVVILPFIVMISVFIFNLNRVAASYDLIVKNITNANEYNTVFKEQMDLVMYQMVARSLDKEEVEEELSLDGPDSLIKKAQEDFHKIEESTESAEARGRLKSIIKLLNTLKRRADEINSTVKISGHYEENMTRLDTDIRIITELIQERISEYIYYESTSMESTRLEIDRRRNMLINASVIATVLITAVTLVLTFITSRSITKPIVELCEATDEVAHGNFDVRTDIESSDELMKLGDSLNSMASQLGGLVDNIKREQINSRNLELRLLQAQINPHFLYNTLDNIVWLSEDDRKEEVASIVTSLSRFFRTTLSGGRDYVRIRDEISHVEAYLEIQQFRYRDILDYEIDIPEKYMDYSIIKMTLQPIVENALYHGIKNKREKGMIRISISERASELVESEGVKDVFRGIYKIEDGSFYQLVLTVEDEGIGMKEEELARIRRIAACEERPSLDNSGFGISNVAERLRLNYGDNCGLRYESEFGKGTKVEILIPRILYEGD